MYYTQEQIDRANQADLVSFLQSLGEQLTRAGNEYRWKRHDSLTVRGNKWYRHSQSKGGAPIDFVMEFFGKSFTEAVELLTGEKGAALVQIALTYLCVAQNLNLPLVLTIQCFFITGIRQEQAGSFAFPANRGIVRQHIEDNHVPGVLGKPLQIHVFVAVVVLRPGLEAHFLHQLAHSLTLRHGAHLLSRAPGPSRSGCRPGWWR